MDALLLALFLPSLLLLAVCREDVPPQGHQGHEHTDHYTNEWVVRILGGNDIAERLAYELGYENLGEVMGFPNTYRMRKPETPPVKKRASERMTRGLLGDVRVLWAEQQFAKKRVKRGVVPSRQSEGEGMPLVRVKRSDLELPEQQPLFFNDELWDHQWYLQDTRTRANLPKLDLRVLPVFRMGITGKNISVVVLDDGIEWAHSDLMANYDASVSYDMNDLDPDPSPKYDLYNSNSHGTRCAGEIAMVANNRKCGVGVAYNSKIGGIRMLDGVVNDRVEGSSLCFNVKKVDVISASWGPNDDGRTVEGPGRLATEGFERGIKEGRGGKGVIYVWAAGNGGSRGDNCNCDGYTSSIYTLSIGSASEHGQFPWYGEMCASTLSTTYSSGAYTDQKITTTDLRNKCTVSHTGTSAAAPLAAGIVALTLDANRSLTWRDIQHLVVWTSKFDPLANNEGWQQNAAGYRFNLRFGFGLMDAYEMVMAAKNWTPVPEKSVCVVQSQKIKDMYLAPGKHVLVEFSFGASKEEESSCEVRYLEHVEVVANIDYPRRGALSVFLTSPQGTRTSVLTPRDRDTSTSGFTNWRFMSVHTWGENPVGRWTLDIVDDISTKLLSGEVGNMTLIIHGTKNQPHYMKNGPKLYVGNITLFSGMRKKKVASVLSLIEQQKAKGTPLDWNDLVGQKLQARQAQVAPATRSVWREELERQLEEEQELLRVHHQLHLRNPGFF